MHNQCGAIPRSIFTIFKHLKSNFDEYTVMISALEIYNEELYDLLVETDDIQSELPQRPVSDRNISVTSGRSGHDTARARKNWAALRQGLRVAVRKVLHHRHQKFAEHHKKLRITYAYDSPSSRRVMVENLAKIQLAKPEEIFPVLRRCAARRATHETLMNAASSRSHCVFSIQIRQVQSSTVLRCLCSSMCIVSPAARK